MLKWFKFYTFCMCCVFLCALNTAQAVNVQTLKTKDGVSVWLVESHALPMVSAQVTFRAGSAFEPEGKEGVALLTASLMNEGAGHLSGEEFIQKLESMGASIGGSADKLNLSINMQTLTKHKKDVFKLLGLAISQPLFEEEAFGRMQAETLSALKRSRQSNSAIAMERFEQALYGSHPYGHPVMGYEGTVSKLTVADVKALYGHFFTKKNMVVSIVGDMTAKEALSYTEKYLSDLPKGDKRFVVEQMPSEPEPILERIEMNVPQSKVILGHLGIDRHHPDYFAAYMMNYILGGGGFNSRLMEEVREKRGLAYGVSSYFDVLPQRGGFVISTSTKNQDVETARQVILSELRKIAEKGVTQAEYEGAKSYLSGSFPLRLDSNNKILSYLSVMQMEGLGADYLDTWVANVNAVSKADIERVAKELIDTQALVTVIVGGQK